MKNYIDGFVFPLPKDQLNIYTEVTEQVALIWKEYGAISYQEFIGDDMNLEETRSFSSTLKCNEDEVVIFGWVVFPNKETREYANSKVPMDNRMQEMVTPL